MADTVQPIAPEEKGPEVVDNSNVLEQGKEVNVVGADAALKYAASETIVIDEATNKRLLRLTDWHILPWLCTLYFLQYLDKGM